MTAPVSTAASALATTVLSINELLEIILSHLPPRDLLLLQRTATIWQDTVRKSAKIQTKLCLRDDQNPTMAWIQIRFPATVWPYPTSRSAGTLRYDSAGSVAEHEDFSINASYNELLASQYTRHLSRRISDGEMLFVHDWVRKNIFLQDDRKLSCDDMFLTQPPARRVMLVLCCRCRTYTGLFKQGPVLDLEVRRSGGVRVRDIRQAVRERCLLPQTCHYDIRIRVLRETWRDLSEQCGLLFPTEDDWRCLEPTNLHLGSSQNGYAAQFRLE